MEKTNHGDLFQDPLAQFSKWQAAARELRDPLWNLMVLATGSRTGTPANRMMILHGLEEGGLLFTVNEGSRKGEHLAENPKVALVYFSPTTRRQVRVIGRARQAGTAISDAHWRKRPRMAQLLDTVVRQGDVLEDRLRLRQLVAATDDQYAGGEVPRPKYWHMYQLLPDEFEFWEQADDRVHLRVRVTRKGSGWLTAILAP